MAKYGVILKLSYKGEAIEEADVPIIVDAQDLEEVFLSLEEDMEIQIELEDFANHLDHTQGILPELPSLSSLAGKSLAFAP